MITTTRVFCSFILRLSKSIRIADRVTYSLTTLVGTRVHRPQSPLTAHTPQQPSIYGYSPANENWTIQTLTFKKSGFLMFLYFEWSDFRSPLLLSFYFFTCLCRGCLSQKMYSGGIIYRRLLRCMCSQGVQGSVYPGTHKGGKAVSHYVHYSDTL